MRKIQDHARQYLYQTALLGQCGVEADWASAAKYFAHEWTKGKNWRLILDESRANCLVIKVLHGLGYPIAELVFGKKPTLPKSETKAKKGKKTAATVPTLPMLWIGEKQVAFRASDSDWAEEPLEEKALADALRQWLKACEQQATPLDQWLSEWRKLAREQTAAWVQQMKEADQEKVQPNMAFGRWLNYLRDFLDPKLPTEKARQLLAQTLLIRQIWPLDLPFPNWFYPVGLAKAFGETADFTLMPEWDKWRAQAAQWVAQHPSPAEFLATWLGQWPGLSGNGAVLPPTLPLPEKWMQDASQALTLATEATFFAAWVQRGFQPYLFTRSLPDAILGAFLSEGSERAFWIAPNMASDQFYSPQRALFQPRELYFWK